MKNFKEEVGNNISEENKLHIARGDDFFDGKWYPEGSIKIKLESCVAVGRKLANKNDEYSF